MAKLINVGDRVMNTWIYEISDGYVMIDTGYPGKLKSVEERMKRRGIRWSDIRYLFLTHAHDDHAGFLNDLMIKCPHIQVIANPDSLPILQRGQNSFKGGCSTQGKASVPAPFQILARPNPVDFGGEQEGFGKTARRKDSFHARPHGRFRLAEGRSGDLPGGRSHERVSQQLSDNDLGRGSGRIRPILGSPVC